MLAKPDFSKTEVVKAYVYSIVAQLARMKTVRIFNPLHLLGNKISVSDIDGLKIFKLYEHPEIHPQIEVMKTEVMKYQALNAAYNDDQKWSHAYYIQLSMQ